MRDEPVAQLAYRDHRDAKRTVARRQSHDLPTVGPVHMHEKSGRVSIDQQHLLIESHRTECAEESPIHLFDGFTPLSDPAGPRTVENTVLGVQAREHYRVELIEAL